MVTIVLPELARHQRVCLVCRITSTYWCLCRPLAVEVLPDGREWDPADHATAYGAYAADWTQVRLTPGVYPLELKTISWSAPREPRAYDCDLDPYWALAVIPATVISSWHGSPLAKGDPYQFTWMRYAYELPRLVERAGDVVKGPRVIPTP